MKQNQIFDANFKTNINKNKRHRLDNKGVEFLKKNQDQWIKVENDFEIADEHKRKNTLFSANYPNQKFTQKKEIDYYFDINNEDPLILDLLFRMNVLDLEKDQKFSNKKDFSDIFNKFCPYAKSELETLIQQNMFKHKQYDCKKNLSSKLKVFKASKSMNNLKKDIPNRNETSFYSIYKIKSFIYQIYNQKVEESIFFKQNVEKTKSDIKKNALVVFDNHFNFSRFEYRIFENKNKEIFRKIQAEERTILMSKIYKPYFQNKIFLTIKNELEKEARKKYNLNINKHSVSVDLKKYEFNAKKTTLSRIKSQIDYQLMNTTYKQILSNNKAKENKGCYPKRNFNVFKMKSMLLKNNHKFSITDHFYSIFKEFEDSYIDPLHSIKEISKITFKCSEHRLLKSYFFGLNFSQTKDKITIKTTFKYDKYYQESASLSLNFELSENLALVYNQMIVSKQSSFYTIFPILHDYLSRNFFKNTLFNMKKFLYKNESNTNLIDQIMKKAGLKFSLIYLKVNSSNLKSLNGVKFGLYNFLDFNFLQALIAINKHLLVLTKTNIRKPNGYLVKRELNYSLFWKHDFLRDNILNIYINEIYNEKILYFIDTRSNIIRKNTIFRNWIPMKILFCLDIQKAGFFNIAALIKNLFDRLKIQSITNQEFIKNQQIVGSRILFVNSEYVQLLLIVEFDLNVLKNLMFLDEFQMSEFFSKIENRIDKKIDNQIKFSCFLILITKKIFKFKIKIVRFEANKTENSSSVKKKKFIEDENKVSIKVIKPKTFISCSKVIMFYCFPDLVENENSNKDSQKSFKKNLHFLDRTITRFYVHPYENTTFLPIFDSFIKRIRVNDFIFKTYDYQKSKNPKFIFDFSLFNQRYKHLSKILSKIIQEHIEGNSKEQNLKVKSLNIFPIIDDFVQKKSSRK
jgi:hypothetical protein